VVVKYDWRWLRCWWLDHNADAGTDVWLMPDFSPQTTAEYPCDSCRSRSGKISTESFHRRPQRYCVKHYSREMLAQQLADVNWLDKVVAAIHRHWRNKNARKRARQFQTA
jgi:hypothetical protein